MIAPTSSGRDDTAQHATAVNVIPPQPLCALPAPTRGGRRRKTLNGLPGTPGTASGGARQAKTRCALASRFVV